jgi:aspartyl/glutamyl-tRNA(Asn/Gln) amidotransferase C subunit
MDLETIKKIAEMARISVPEEELSKVAKDVSNMVSFVETIKNITVPKNMDNKNFEFNILRDDKVSPIESAHDLIEVAPMHQDHFVKVPKIIE